MQRRRLAELIETVDPAWPLVQGWLQAARNQVMVWPADRIRGEATLLELQVTTRSPLGAVALETGGMAFDHGWLRFLGAGCQQLPGSLLAWNGLGSETAAVAGFDGALIVAYDAIGGFFALNGGRFPGTRGSLYYLAPESLEWEDLELTYSEALQWAAEGDLATFYAEARWPGWEREVAALGGDQGILIYPPLFAEGGPIARRHRGVVPMTELWGLNTGGWQEG